MKKIFGGQKGPEAPESQPLLSGFEDAAPAPEAQEEDNSLERILKDAHRDIESIHDGVQAGIWKQEQVKILQQLWKEKYALNRTLVEKFTKEQDPDVDLKLVSAVTIQHLFDYAGGITASEKPAEKMPAVVEAEPVELLPADTREVKEMADE